MVTKYRKKPVEIYALQYRGDNSEEIIEFTEGKAVTLGTGLFIETLEGQMRVSDKDFIIKGIAGEFYPCKSEIFYNSYEVVLS